MICYTCFLRVSSIVGCDVFDSKNYVIYLKTFGEIELLKLCNLVHSSHIFIISISHISNLSFWGIYWFLFGTYLWELSVNEVIFISNIVLEL